MNEKGFFGFLSILAALAVICILAVYSLKVLVPKNQMPVIAANGTIVSAPEAQGTAVAVVESGRQQIRAYQNQVNERYNYLANITDENLAR